MRLRSISFKSRFSPRFLPFLPLCLFLFLSRLPQPPLFRRSRAPPAKSPPVKLSKLKRHSRAIPPRPFDLRSRLYCVPELIRAIPDRGKRFHFPPRDAEIASHRVATRSAIPVRCSSYFHAEHFSLVARRSESQKRPKQPSFPFQMKPHSLEV